MTLSADYIEEPNLIFGGRKEEKDPRVGLNYHGPFTYPDEPASIPLINVGIIGDSASIEKCKKILKLIRGEVPSLQPNKWLFPPYPGMSKRTNFKCELSNSEAWEEIITIYEIDRLLKIANPNERVSEATELYNQKIKSIAEEDAPPHVIICCLPEDVEKYCGISEHTRGAKTSKPTDSEKQLEEFKKVNQKFLSDFAAEIAPKKRNQKLMTLEVA